MRMRSPVLMNCGTWTSIPFWMVAGLRLPRPLYNRVESLAPGSWTEEHRHPWCQFSYAISGVLGVRTPDGDYVAPPRYPVWVPPGVPHQVVNRRQTEMRSLYLDPAFAAALPQECRVLEVTPLARELIRRIATLPGRTELYNLRADPSEEDNQAERDPERMQSMLKRLTDYAWEMAPSLYLQELSRPHQADMPIYWGDNPMRP